MVDAKQAVRVASDWAKEILAPAQVQDLSLEELELEEGGQTWRVTLGFFRPRKKGLFAPENEFEGKKEYKIFRVEAQTGDVLGMRMWK